MHELHHARARDAPDLNADAARRRPRERERPLDVARKPAAREPKHGRLCEPELQEDAKPVGAEPPEGLGSVVELYFG